MEWNEKLRVIVDYVENHLQRKEEPIDREETASIAGCSLTLADSQGKLDLSEK